MKLCVARAAAVAALLAGLAACWTQPRRPQGSSSLVPGTLWVTPAQPWRVGAEPSLIAASGATALVAASAGWIARLDLDRGQVARERRLPDLWIDQLLALPRGGWLLVGMRGGRTIAAAIDPATLEARDVVTGGERGPQEKDHFFLSHARAAILGEGVALAIDGLPLAIYDPATWQVRRVVDPTTDWRWAAGAGATLYAARPDGMVRFDLAAGTQEALEAPRYRADATASYLVAHAPAGKGWTFDAVGPGRKGRIATGERDIALDPGRDRLAVREGGAVHVYALADGRRVASYPLGDSGHSYKGAMTFDRGRLIVATGAVVRVIDLATSAITPAGDPPYGSGALAVTDAGELLLVGRLGGQVVRVAGGRVLGTNLLGSEEVAVVAPHLLTRYAVHVFGDARRLELREPGRSAPVGAWRPEDSISGAWLGAAGGLAIDLDGLSAQRALLQATSAGLRRLTTINPDASVNDVDVDAGRALVSVAGTVYLVGLRAPAVVRGLPLPGCEQYADATLERGGDRVLLRDGVELAVHRWAGGPRVGAAHIEDATESVAFVPGQGELLIAGRDSLSLWDPATGALRRWGGVPGISEVQVAPGGRRAALSFYDGRVALVDLDALRAAMTPGRAAPMAPDADLGHCDGGDPLRAGEVPEGIPELDDLPDPDGSPDPADP